MKWKKHVNSLHNSNYVMNFCSKSFFLLLLLFVFAFPIKTDQVKLCKRMLYKHSFGCNASVVLVLFVILLFYYILQKYVIKTYF